MNIRKYVTAGLATVGSLRARREKDGHALDEGTDEMRLIDPKGRVRKVHYVPNINGFGASAWVRIGPFKKIENVAAGENAIDNLVKRLEPDGWKVVSE